MWRAVFCDFGAQIPYGSCPYSPDQSWAVFWSILGFVLSYMQPTMNPCGYLVVKQAKNLSQLAWGIGEGSYGGLWFQG